MYWLRYASKTADCVRLDAGHYPSMLFGGLRMPRPSWVCQSPDGGIHADANIGQIDIHVADEPPANIELNWTEIYTVTVVRASWLLLIADLIAGNRIFVGDLFLKGYVLPEWKTLHGLTQPVLTAAKTAAAPKLCPICGSVATWPRGRPYLLGRNVGEQLLIVNGGGVFVREDVAVDRKLRKPNGAFKPSRVQWRHDLGDFSV